MVEIHLGDEGRRTGGEGEGKGGEVTGVRRGDGRRRIKMNNIVCSLPICYVYATNAHEPHYK